MNLLFALLSGLIFGLGLILAGMANPAKVLAFLDQVERTNRLRCIFHELTLDPKHRQYKWIP